jgi:hypothetical protein
VLQTIRRLLIRPGCFRLERELPGGVCTHDICAPWQGTQWNRIEHKLFAFISMNWRAKPLVSYLAIIQLIASTTTKTGLTVTCQLDANAYEKAIKVTDDEMESLSVKPHSFHGEWNYTIAPRRPDG